MLLCISVAIALVMAVLLFRLFFHDLPEFVEALCRPSFLTVKFGIWVALAIGAGIGGYFVLPRHVPQLAARKAEAKPIVASEARSKARVQARTKSIPQTNAVVAGALPERAAVLGVKPGDTVQISAIQPAIALRSAVITSMDDTQLTIRATSGAYTILWKNLTALKTVTGSTNKAGANQF